VLSDAGLPATFFITAGRLEQRSEVWWDRLENMFFGCEPVSNHLELAIGGHRFWGDIRSSMARTRVHLALYWRLRPLRPADIESILTELEAQLGVQPVARETHRWMNVEELRTVSMSRGMDVGAHTLTHPFLATLPAEEQRQEIEGSRLHLERLLGTPVSLFSYPYGGHDAFNAATTQLVRESGYTLACTGTGGLAHPPDYPFRIPRNVVGDWDASTFEQWLERQFAS
jgi:peptidoglycan/xylan/chitin deacetylase (PgdA/CDA1 family)